MNKIVLSPFDTKRFYRDDGITSLAYRHYKTGQAKFGIESKNNQDVGKGGRCQHKKVLDAINNTWEQIEISGDLGYKRYDYSFEEVDSSFDLPDPGFIGTAEISSDEDGVVDRDAPVYQAPYKKCPYLDDEALEDSSIPSQKKIISNSMSKTE